MSANAPWFGSVVGAAVRGARRECLTVCLLLACVPQLQAEIGWQVRIEDPTNRYADMHSAIENTTNAAGRDWGSYLTGSATVEVVVRFADILTANGGARVGEQTGTMNGVRLYEFGPQTVIRTGLGPSPGRDDLLITLGYNYMDNWSWWDPDPYARTELVPTNMLDAYSAVLHEIGHGLGFYGWRDWKTGSLPGDYMSTYDQWVYTEDGLPWFGGPSASAEYGGPVPLTLDNLMHYGNEFPLPGWELAENVELMNGVQSMWGTRQYIGDLDVAFLEDIGYTVVPEPATLILFLAGSLGIVGIAYRCRRHER